MENKEFATLGADKIQDKKTAWYSNAFMRYAIQKRR